MAKYQIWVMNRFNRSDLLALAFGGYKEVFGEIDLYRKTNGYEREVGLTIQETMIKHMAGKKAKLIKLGETGSNILDGAVGCFYVMGKDVELKHDFEYNGILYKYLGRV